MRRALVTGAAGFIGSHLVDRLRSDGWSVVAIDDLSGPHRWPDSTAGAHRVELQVGDATAAERLLELVAATDVVFHLASPIGVVHTHRRPDAVSTSILTGGRAIVEGCAATKTPLVVTSSSEAYGRQRAAFLDETLEPRFTHAARWAYGSAKLAVEHLAFDAGAAHGFAVWVARLFNVVGAGQRPDTGLVVPTFCAAALDGAPLRVDGDGTAVRAFVDVHDLVDGLLALPRTPALVGSPINLGGVRHTSVTEVAELVRALVGNVPIVREDPGARHGGRFTAVARRVPDLARAERHLGWSPSITLETSILGCAASIDDARQGRAG